MTETTIHPTHIERMNLWKELKDIVGFTPQCDGLSSGIYKTIVIDLIAFDRDLARYHSDYDHQKAEWMGLPCSCAEFIQRRFGNRAFELTNILASKP